MVLDKGIIIIMEAPVLIKIKDHHLVNPNQITSIDLKGRIIFLSGTRYTEVGWKSAL